MCRVLKRNVHVTVVVNHKYISPGMSILYQMTCLCNKTSKSRLCLDSKTSCKIDIMNSAPLYKRTYEKQAIRSRQFVVVVVVVVVEAEIMFERIYEDLLL